MIAFSCSHCGMKFKVQAEFAGRSTRCPTCKQTLVVPGPDANALTVVAGEISGSSSSLDRLDVPAAVTVPLVRERGERAPIRDLLAQQTTRKGRYVIEGELARGGMGVVLRAVDCDIRREVAVKYLLDQSDARKKLRFVEEAQITGQLEHPNIVPIHELGVDAEKRVYFSMKMVRGRSLGQVVEALRSRSRTAEKEWPLGRLLGVFVNVCHALAYAHARGVVHRDLKPANIMVGDFGEVYVMDWGLAKVLGANAAPSGTMMPTSSVGPASGTKLSTDKVVTSRNPDADLTQDGAVVGTPAYMPPEQAAGRLDAVDTRSDVYSLGAILYELLALQPPVESEGGYLAILIRVMAGEIVPIEKRSLRRGKLPPELCAIARKALALKAEDRYPNVEALRQDVERYMEGRSVSAKEDSTRELIFKFVRRNKGVSAATLAAMVVLAIVIGFSMKINYQARVRAEANYESFVAEQKDKRERGRRSAPLFVRDALASAERKQLDYALAQVSVALEYDPELPEAHLLKGQILLVRKDFAAAQPALKVYVQARADDADAARLLELCQTGRPDDSRVMAEIMDVFAHQGVLGLAEQVEGNKNRLYAIYRQRIEKAWPGQGARLQFPNGKCELDLGNVQEASDLSPLAGIPIERLTLRGWKRLRDLRPLADMPLTYLDLTGCPDLRDLTPLGKSPLNILDLSDCTSITDLTPLKGKALTGLNLARCGGIRDFGPLRGMPLQSLTLSFGPRQADLAPLRGAPITALGLAGWNHLEDLSAIEGLPLAALDLSWCSGLKDFRALKRMNLQRLSLMGLTRLTNLDGISGLPLRDLNAARCEGLRDISGLRGMKLEVLFLDACPELADLSPLEGMPLRILQILECPKVNNLGPLRNMPLIDLAMRPRRGIPGMDAVRHLPALQNVLIGGRGEDHLSRAEFFRRWDAGELDK